jgi:hypothetical protein
MHPSHGLTHLHKSQLNGFRKLKKEVLMTHSANTPKKYMCNDSNILSGRGKSVIRSDFVLVIDIPHSVRAEEVFYLFCDHYF